MNLQKRRAPTAAKGLPRWHNDKQSACQCRRCRSTWASVPGLGRSPGEGNGKPLQYSCLEKPMNRGPWQATVPGVAKSWTQLSSEHTYTVESGNTAWVSIKSCRTICTSEKITMKATITASNSINTKSRYGLRGCLCLFKVMAKIRPKDPRENSKIKARLSCTKVHLVLKKMQMSL